MIADEFDEHDLSAGRFADDRRPLRPVRGQQIELDNVKSNGSEGVHSFALGPQILHDNTWTYEMACFMTYLFVCRHFLAWLSLRASQFASTAHASSTNVNKAP